MMKGDDERGTKSCYNLVEIKRFMQIKAMLHFILSYPVKLLEYGSDNSKLQESITTLERWVHDCLINGTPMYSRSPPPIALSGAYVPKRWLTLHKCLKNRDVFNYDISDGIFLEKSPSWAIKSAIRQASESILEANMSRIAISGQEAVEVAKALKDMPKIQSKFDVVLHIPFSEDQSIEEIDKLIQANSLPLLSLKESEKTYSFLLILDCSGAHQFQKHALRTLMSRDHTCLVLVTHSGNIHQTAGVDVVIRMEDHLLPLELFCQHVGRSYVDLSPAHQKLALDFMVQCDRDLVVVVLLAKELQSQSKVEEVEIKKAVKSQSKVEEVEIKKAVKSQSMHVWKVALHELKTNHSSDIEEGASKAMIHVLTFIWNQKDPITKLCIRWVAIHRNIGEELTTFSLVSSWLGDGLVQTEGEGIELSNRLIKSGFLEHDYSQRITMREEIKDVLLKYVIPLDMPPFKAWPESEAEIIILKSSEVIELPDHPICLRAVLLSIQNNRNIMKIPPLFFRQMPGLSTLNLSHTSIKTLPASISSLISLRKLFLRGCDLFLELPPEIGQLSDLEVIDLEGTRVTHLPYEMAQLKKLRSLKVSFYALGNRHQASKQQIPTEIFSELKNLEELLIGKDEDEDELNADISKLSLYPPKEAKNYNENHLSSIMLHVPATFLLNYLPQLWTKNYKLTVGRCGQRMISRIPSEVEEKFRQQTRLLKYVNGELLPTPIKDILEYSNAFILDRHWTVKSLSEFAIERNSSLKLCLLVECNELRTIFDKGKDVFQGIEYLHIYYMKNLRSIWSEQVTTFPVFSLKYLNLSTCRILKSVFPISLFSKLPQLEELVVEDCPQIENLLSRECSSVNDDCYIFPKLKKLSLRELPQLVSISIIGLKIAPKLEKLIIFYCPKLKSISEVLGGDLKVIKGETEWWGSLSWKVTDRFASIFVPLEKDGDLMTQFTED